MKWKNVACFCLHLCDGGQEKEVYCITRHADTPVVKKQHEKFACSVLRTDLDWRERGVIWILSFEN